jgi:hypothetical protein
MGRYAHKTKSQRKIITIQEWAIFLGVSREIIYKYLGEYKQADRVYDPADVYSILAFHRYIIFTYVIDEKWVVQWIASNKEKLL